MLSQFIIEEIIAGETHELHAFIANRLFELYDLIEGELNEIEWDITPYTLSKHMPISMGFMPHNHIIEFPDYRVSHPSLPYRNSLRGLDIDIFGDIVYHPHYNVEGTQFKKAANRFKKGYQ